MTTYSKRSIEAFLILSALTAPHSTNAFQGVSVPHTFSTRASSSSTSSLHALIYGWDGQPEEDTTTGFASSSSSYLDSIGSCSHAGSLVAESLSYNRERAGHLARLAVAFSPPERALTLDRIENVEVLCVHDHSIDIAAVVCEDHGCVTLSVPITFPQFCSHDEHSSDVHHLEGCIMDNLDALDVTAGTLLLQQQQASHDECILDERFEAFPDWWIPLECIDPSLAGDCETVRQLLNEAEFQPDVNALAQDALRRIEAGEDYRVLAAKVAILGTAGLCFKVHAESELDGSKHVLDVVHPFDAPMNNVEALRAAVLGAIAAAEGN